MKKFGKKTEKEFDDRRRGAKGDVEMSRQRSNTMRHAIPAPLHPATLRAGLVLAVIAAMAAFAIRVQTEQTPTTATLSANMPDQH